MTGLKKKIKATSINQEFVGYYRDMNVPNILLFQRFFFLFVFRAVGCIFGELLNNSPLFPVSVNNFILIKTKPFYFFQICVIYIVQELQKTLYKYN